MRSVQSPAARGCRRRVWPRSEQRPRHRRHLAARGREEPVLLQPGASRCEGCELVGAEQLRKTLAELAVQLVGDAADASQLLGGQGLAQPAPQDGAQLVVVVEGEAVIDAVAVPALHGEDVVALA